MGKKIGSRRDRGIKTAADAERARIWLMRSVTRAAEMKLGQILDFVIAECAKDVAAERERCAKIAENWHPQIAAAIRAPGD